MDSRTLIRKGSVIGALALGSLAVAGVGVATATNGKPLLLGHHNSATKTTTLTDHKGTPLSLVGKKSKPPLKVNSSKVVAHLNANLLDGLTASQLLSAARGRGGAATFDTAPNEVFASTGEAITLKQAVAGALQITDVASTGTLPAGHYIIVATGYGLGAECWADTVANADAPEQWGTTPIDPSTGPGLGSLSVTRAITLTSARAIHEYCGGVLTNADPTQPGGALISAGISATPVGTVTVGTTATPTSSSSTGLRGTFHRR